MGLHLNLTFKGLRTIPLYVFALISLISANTVLAGQDGLGPKITIPESSGKQCVMPVDEIRRKHPDILKHDRIKTMREGVRAEANGANLTGSLKQCINCHAVKDDNNQFVRIDNDQHFCASCHKYAAVTVDCFQCHRDIPEGSSNFHALTSHKKINYNNSLSEINGLNLKDLANISPETNIQIGVSSDE